MLIRHHFPECMTIVHKWNTCLCMPLDCTVHRLARAVQLWGHTGMGQMFTIARVGWWNNVQVRMLHREIECYTGK